MPVIEHVPNGGGGTSTRYVVLDVTGAVTGDTIVKQANGSWKVGAVESAAEVAAQLDEHTGAHGGRLHLGTMSEGWTVHDDVYIDLVTGDIGYMMEV